jgi:glycine/D-amino acid oxidase-like deaminating enzyme
VKVRPEGIIFGSELAGHHDESCDACIIGSGPGGAVAADELVRKGQNVLMIEEGPLPVPGTTLLPHEAMKFYRDCALFVTTWPLQLPIFSGRVFGGTSVINSGTCFHTPERIFDWWEAELGVEFDRTEWRGIERELDRDLSIRLCPMDRMSPDNRLFAEGLDRLGLSGGSPLMRCENGCVGSGRCCFICPKDAKQAMHLNLLKRSLQRGMRAMVETRADHLLHEGRRITGLVCRTECGGKVVVRAKRYLLAMGAIETPRFLLGNGLRRPYRAIGHHLSIHPASKVFAEMPYAVRPWEGVPQSYRYEHPDHPDVHFEGASLPSSPGATTVPAMGADLGDWMRIYDHVAGFGFFLSDSQYGRVLRVPGAGPIVRYGLTPRDVDNFCFAVRLIARVWFAMGAERVLLPVIHSPNVCRSMEEVEREIRPDKLQAKQLYVSAFHPLGTCRFSAKPEEGVIDKLGRCHHHENLYVCDGSAIAGPLHVNPQVTIMAYSRLVARHLS